MPSAGDLIIPAIIAVAACFALFRKKDVFASLTAGAGEGLGVIVKILPSLIGLLCGVYMLRASGALDYVALALSPLLKLIGIPPQCAPLVVLRPFSGSGALAAATEIIKTNGADSMAGRTAAVILASSETTLYTAAIYLGAAKVTKSRYALPAAFVSEFIALVAAGLTTRYFWG